MNRANVLHGAGSVRGTDTGLWCSRDRIVSGGWDASGMIPWNLLVLDKALRASWAADTCSPDDQADWQPSNPAWGHCDITALIVNDIFGGDLMVGEVHLNGDQRGFHWWNRLPSGVELDLTHEQFLHGQTVSAARVVQRPPGPLTRRGEEYLLLRERVVKHLGHLPEPAA
ncbi:YunG family protein [Streptomyces echinatus]